MGDRLVRGRLERLSLVAVIAHSAGLTRRKRPSSDISAMPIGAASNARRKRSSARWRAVTSVEMPATPRMRPSAIVSGKRSET